MEAKTRLSQIKRCTSCRVVKDRAEFVVYRYKTNQGKASQRLDSRCRLCARERRKRRYHADPERARVYIAKYRAENRDKILAQLARHRAENRPALLRSRVLSEQTRRLKAVGLNTIRAKQTAALVFEMAKVGGQYLDAYSGELIDQPTLDHIEPISTGGQHAYENLCITSFANNRSKNKTPMLVWMVRRAHK